MKKVVNIYLGDNVTLFIKLWSGFDEWAVYPDFGFYEIRIYDPNDRIIFDETIHKRKAQDYLVEIPLSSDSISVRGVYTMTTRFYIIESDPVGGSHTLGEDTVSFIIR